MEDLFIQSRSFSGKGNKERVVPLKNQSLKIIRNRNLHIKKVFPEVNNIDTIGTAWQRMRRETKLNIRFHDIRSTYASYYMF